MPKRSSIDKGRNLDVNQIAKRLVDELTSDGPDMEEGVLSEDVRHLIAVALGRQGGLKGGKARAKKLSAKKRTEIAKKAAEARWGTRTSE